MSRPGSRSPSRSTHPASDTPRARPTSPASTCPAPPAAPAPATDAPDGRSMLRSNVVVAIGTALVAVHRDAARARVRHRHRPDPAGRRLQRRQQLPQRRLRTAPRRGPVGDLVPMFSRHAEEGRPGVHGSRRERGADRSVRADGDRDDRCSSDLPHLLAEPGRGRQRRPLPQRRTWLTRIFLIQIFFYGVSGALRCAAQRPAQLLRPRPGRRYSPTCSSA